ncbi:hypothetical protein Y032_0141g2241 [Ancylostoma ceylanicum]|uniref:Uncharacterized protein n=1 Tax=Ancylostoma ceylanicum TaxID=53326 RepID=A0A016T3S8_9BILA|nr:hypothetical protein Y032_0141g2241 [Ancylostoma ceylanicum]
MQWLLLFAIPLDQHASHMDCLGRSTVGYEPTLICGNSDVTDSTVDNVHDMRQHTHRPTIRKVAIPLRDQDYGAPLLIHRGLFLYGDKIEECCQPFDLIPVYGLTSYRSSSGPIAFADLLRFSAE